MLQITGVIKVKFNEQKVSDSFKKREFVITENSSQYPQHINFQLTQDKCSLIDNFNAGDTVKVSFNLRGREWTNPQGEVKYFNSLDAWRIENADSNQNTAQSAPQSNGYQAPVQNTPPVISSSVNLNSQEDDLPF
jgi:translation initiation factor IF-3